MSSTNRGTKRKLDDHYATPPELAKLICEELRYAFRPIPRRILEPGCGEGTFLDAIAEVWPEAEAVGVDLNSQLVRHAVEKGHAAVVDDVLEPTGDWAGKRYDIIIGNPPFKYADEFILSLIPKLARGGLLAFILRLNFLGGQRRYKDLWSKTKPTHVFVMPARPGFTPDGKTDSTEYMLAVFSSHPPHISTLSYLNNIDVENKWDPEIHVDVDGGERARQGCLDEVIGCGD